MLNLFSDNKPINSTATLNAIHKSQAIIEFTPDGKIIAANRNFLDAMGYDLNEIQGKHHSLFVDKDYARSSDYQQFWHALAGGKYQAAEYKRYGKGGREVWIQASYNPVFDGRGRTLKVVKCATDITPEKLRNADYLGQINAINKSQAVIEFDVHGIISYANQNFLSVMGYTFEEIEGKHHNLFVDSDYKNSMEYKLFWESLARGEYQTAEYKRFGKGGKEVYIQGSYNPILDLNGKPFKVVKYASDITAQIMGRQKSEHVKNVIVENIQQIEKNILSASAQSSRAESQSLQTSSTVQTIAAGAEELNSSVEEIARSMALSKVSVDAAVEQTATADRATQQLTAAAQAMSGIVDLIQAITSQINLLALNATIESARAGDAGKGFAVVANEVKNLAMQTTTATEQISKEIVNMQTISQDVVGALHVIKDSIENVRSNVTGVAAAVEEQSMVTQEMSANMQSAANAVTNISDSLIEIARATESASNSAKEISAIIQ